MTSMGMSSPTYDRDVVQPMRDELTSVGFKELLTPQDVDRSLEEGNGTALLVLNSVCGCAAGNVRPGVGLALQRQRIPDRLITAFAGQEKEAVARAREYLQGEPPSSPCIALLRNREVLKILHRHDLQDMEAADVADELSAWFGEYCSAEGPSIPREEFEKLPLTPSCGSSVRMD